MPQEDQQFESQTSPPYDTPKIVQVGFIVLAILSLMVILALIIGMHWSPFYDWLKALFEEVESGRVGIDSNQYPIFRAQ